MPKSFLKQKIDLLCRSASQEDFLNNKLRIKVLTLITFFPAFQNRLLMCNRSHFKCFPSPKIRNKGEETGNSSPEAYQCMPTQRGPALRPSSYSIRFPFSRLPAMVLNNFFSPSPPTQTFYCELEISNTKIRERRGHWKRQRTFLQSHPLQTCIQVGIKRKEIFYRRLMHTETYVHACCKPC